MAYQPTPEAAARRALAAQFDRSAIQFETITVRAYGPGNYKATHGRLDRGSNRMVFAEVALDQSLRQCPHYMSDMLLEAAEDHNLDVHAENPVL